MAESELTTSAIYGQMVSVMKSIGAVSKNQKNTFDGYVFRGIDDVYNALGPAMQNVGVFVTPEVFSRETEIRQSAKGKPQLHVTVGVKYTFYSGIDGSSVVCVVYGEGMDRGDKALNKAMSAAYKNAIFQTFAIPTNDQSDSENDSPEIAAEKPKQEKKAQPKQKSPIEDLTYTGFIDDVQVQAGKKGQKEWKRYGLKCGKDWISTFDVSDGVEAERCCDEGIEVGLTYTFNGKYKTLTSIFELDNPKADPPPVDEEPPPHDDSDVPF